MKKKWQSQFSPRQYMVSEDFELYYYSDSTLHKVDSHTHNYYEFYFFLEGDVSMQIGQELYPVSYGDLLLIPPRVSHRLINHDPAVPYRRFVFWISQDFYQHLCRLSPDYGYMIEQVKEGRTFLFHNDQITFNSIQAKLTRLLEEMRSQRFGHEALLSLCVNDLILLLNRVVYEKKHPHQASELEPLYPKVCNFIETHLDEDLSLDRLAREFYVSKYHVAHLFKANLGISIHQYITKKRLALCEQAIRNATSITEAYQACGFGDYSSFYRAFKKEFGLSPKEYRDQQAFTRELYGRDTSQA